jgi:hypothetical protein
MKMLNLLKKLEFTDKSNYLFFSNLIILAIFLVVPLDLFVKNIQGSFPILPKFFFIYLANILFLILLNLITYILLKKYLENIVFLKLLFFILIWIIFNGLYFPSIGFKGDFWMPVELNIRLRYQIIIKLILCFFICYFFMKISVLRNKLKTVFYTYFLIITILNVALLITKFEKKKNINFNTFGNGNVLVVSFDGISGSILEDIIENNQKYKSNFKDFTLYTNYITFFPATKNSLSSELISIKDINSFEKKNFIINDKEVIKRVYTYGVYSDFSLNKNKLYEGIFFINDKTFFLINLYNIYIFPSFARWSNDFIINFVERFYSKNPSIYISFMKKISLNFSKFTNEDLKYQNDVLRVSIFESDIVFNKFKYDKNTNTNDIYFFHNAFSHYRIRHNSNCENISFKERIKYQSYFGNLEITKCVAKKINFIIDKLKENGVYDTTTIIFKSDHGKPVGYYKNEYQNMKINSNYNWGPGRYNSFFMIKKNDFQSSEIKINKEMILNSDVYMHYCDIIYLKPKCIKNDDDFILIPSNKKAFMDLNDYEKFYIDRNKKLYQQLKEKNKLNVD